MLSVGAKFEEAVRFINSLAFENQVVNLTALVRMCLDANMGIYRICTVFYKKAQRGMPQICWSFLV